MAGELKKTGDLAAEEVTAADDVAAEDESVWTGSREVKKIVTLIACTYYLYLSDVVAKCLCFVKENMSFKYCRSFAFAFSVFLLQLD